jgi:transposase-like protein
MPTVRKSHPRSLKANVAAEAIKAHKTAAQIGQMFGVHPTQVGGWEKQALAGSPDIFGNCPRTDAPAGRRRQGRTLQADRPTKGGVGLSQKPSGAVNRTPAGPETVGICTLVVPGGMAVHFFGVL